MSSYVYKTQNKEFVSPSFTINKDDHNVINIEEILINGEMCNCIDYKSNYFAYLTRDNIDNNSQHFYISGCDKYSSLQMYLLHILRIPVKKYESRQELIDEVNKSYANSMCDLLNKNYFDKSAYITFHGTTREGSSINTDSFKINVYGYKKIIDLLKNNNLNLVNTVIGYNNSDISSISSDNSDNIINIINLSNNNNNKKI